jgi:hypothetical protein
MFINFRSCHLLCHSWMLFVQVMCMEIDRTNYIRYLYPHISLPQSSGRFSLPVLHV